VDDGNCMCECHIYDAALAAAAQPAESVDMARDAVMSAINAAPFDADRPEPIQALNAQSVPLDVPAQDMSAVVPAADSLPPAMDMPLPAPVEMPASAAPEPVGSDMPELGLPGSTPTLAPIAPPAPTFMPPSAGVAIDPSLPQPMGTAPVNPPPILPPIGPNSATVPMTPYQHPDDK
jgi:hypothetical protein